MNKEVSTSACTCKINEYEYRSRKYVCEDVECTCVYYANYVPIISYRSVNMKYFYSKEVSKQSRQD